MHFRPLAALCALIATTHLSLSTSAHQNPGQTAPALESPSPIASLNHVVAYVDAGTAAAIASSGPLKEFAAVSVTTVEAAGGVRWTGRYINGRQTYLEFFSPDDNQRRPRGTVTLALGVDRPGGLAAVQRRLEGSTAKGISELRRRRLGDREVDWFQSLGIFGTRPRPFFVWAMEYTASYFDEPGAAKEPAEGPDDVVSRERYNSDDYQRHLMRDITAVDIAVIEDDYRLSEPLLQAAGLQLAPTADGMRARGGGTDLTFRFVAPDAIGLRRIAFVLNRPAADARRETIGDSTLTIGPGDQAEWVFGR